jgi:hypothetical protein
MPDPISHAEMIAAAPLSESIGTLRKILAVVEQAAAADAIGRKHQSTIIGAAKAVPRLQAAIAHLERTQWRPIEEWDGPEKQQALIWLPSTGIFLAVWMEKDGWGTSEQPTHFMLPPSPETPR